MTRKDEPVSAVVDTNLFISGLIKRPSIPHQLVEAFRQGAFTLILTEQLLKEYRRVLPRPKFREKYGLTVEEVGAFLFLVETNAHMVEPLRRLPVKVRDEQDERVLGAALGGKAEYLITGDDDLLVLRDDPQIGNLKIVTAREFLDTLKGGSSD